MSDNTKNTTLPSSIEAIKEDLARKAREIFGEDAEVLVYGPFSSIEERDEYMKNINRSESIHHGNFTVN